MLVNMKILYATETGNARDVAERVARECSRQSINKISLTSIDAYDARQLPKEDKNILLFVCSTMGSGRSTEIVRKILEIFAEEKFTSLNLSVKS